MPGCAGGCQRRLVRAKMVRSKRKCKPFFGPAKAPTSPVQRRCHKSAMEKIRLHPKSCSNLLMWQTQRNTGAKPGVAPINLTIRHRSMSSRPLAFALLICALLGSSGTAAPLIGGTRELASRASPEMQGVRWRHRWSRDYEWSGRASRAGDDTGVFTGENPFSLLESRNWHMRRHRGWVNPPPAQ